MRHFVLFAPLLAFACAKEVPPRELPFDPPSEYEFEAPSAAQPLSPAELEAAIPVALEEVFRVDPAQLFDSYNLVRQRYQQSADSCEGCCPQYNPFDLSRGVVTWVNFFCQSPSGAIFDGNNTAFVLPAPIEKDGRTFERNDFLFGSVRIYADNEHMDLSSGTLLYDVSRPLDQPDNRFFFGRIFGNFTWDGPAADSTWFSEPTSVDLNIDAEKGPRGSRLDINGGISGLSGPFNAMLFQGLRAVHAEDGLTCELEPANGGFGLMLRDTNGFWYEVRSQGAFNPGENPQGCDGISEVRLNGATLGTIQADFSRLFQWGQDPWHVAP